MGRLIAIDCIEAMKAMEPESVDTVVTDPPYALSFMGHSWDSLGSPREQQERHLEWVREAFRVLKPGGYILAFGGTRTYHRLACAIEDAGFEIRDSLHWIYGSGFPKSLDVSKAIARRAGGDVAAREAIVFMQKRREELGLTRIELETRIFGRSDGNVRNWEEGISLPRPGLWPSIKHALGLKETDFDDIMERGDIEVNVERGNYGYQKNGKRWLEERMILAPDTDLAKAWIGWGTALKPSHEPIIMARKPFVDNNRRDVET